MVVAYIWDRITYAKEVEHFFSLQKMVLIVELRWKRTRKVRQNICPDLGWEGCLLFIISYIANYPLLPN